MNRQLIFSTEKFHFFAKNSGRQKRGEEGGGFSTTQIISLVLVLLVIGGVLLFFYKNDINQYFRNLLPTSNYNQTSDEVIAGADELIKNSCPVVVAETYPRQEYSSNEVYYKINVSGKMIQTDIYRSTPKSDGSYEIKKKELAPEIWFFVWKISSGDVFKSDLSLGKIGVDKVVVIDPKYMPTVPPIIANTNPLICSAFCLNDLDEKFIDTKKIYSNVGAGYDYGLLQCLLNEVISPPISVDCVSGRETGDAIKEFQSSVDLKVDGLAGKETLAKLKEALVLEGYTNVDRFFALTGEEITPEQRLFIEQLKIINGSISKGSGKFCKSK